MFLFQVLSRAEFSLHIAEAELYNFISPVFLEWEWPELNVRLQKMPGGQVYRLPPAPTVRLGCVAALLHGILHATVASL